MPHVNCIVFVCLINAGIVMKLMKGPGQWIKSQMIKLSDKFDVRYKLYFIDEISSEDVV